MGQGATLYNSTSDATAGIPDGLGRLLSMARQGQSEAWERVVKAIVPIIRSKTRSLVGEDAFEFGCDDVIQEVLAKLFRNLHAFRAKGSDADVSRALVAWLNRTTTTTTINLFRASRSRQPQNGHVVNGVMHATGRIDSWVGVLRGQTSPKPSQIVRCSEAVLRVQQAIHALPTIHQQIVLRYFRDDQTFSEIRDALADQFPSITYHKVSYGFHSALRELKPHLASLR